MIFCYCFVTLQLFKCQKHNGAQKVEKQRTNGAAASVCRCERDTSPMRDQRSVCHTSMTRIKISLHRILIRQQKRSCFVSPLSYLTALSIVQIASHDNLIEQVTIDQFDDTIISIISCVYFRTFNLVGLLNIFLILNSAKSCDSF